MRLSISTLIAPLLALAAAPSPRGTVLAFAPEPGTAVAKTARSSLSLALVRAAMTVRGEVVQVELPDVTYSLTRDLKLIDVYDAVEPGRALVLRRTYERAAEQSLVEGTPNIHREATRKSPLEGARVVFTWSADEQTYSAAFVDDGDDGDDGVEGSESTEDREHTPEKLQGLDAELDLTALLPAAEVDEGERWKVELDKVAPLFALGGDLHFERAAEEQRDELFERALAEKLAGTLECTFAGTRTVEGRELAIIKLDLAARGTAEDDGGGQAFVTKRAVEVELTLAGELRWDAAAGHFASLELAGKVGVTRTEGTAPEEGGDAAQRDVETELEGDLRLTFDAQAS